MKKRNQLSLSHQDDCKTMPQNTKKGSNTEPPHTLGATMNQQQQHHRLRTDSSLSHWGGGGLSAFYWYQIFAIDSVRVRTQKLFSSHGASVLLQCSTALNEKNSLPLGANSFL